MRFVYPILVIAVLIPIFGCNPVYAPPVRVSHYGAPAKPKTGQMEIGGTYDQLFGGSGLIAYALTDQVQLDFGVDGIHKLLVMGHAGVRYAPLNRVPLVKRIKFTLDFEGGVGAGVGGENSGESGWDDLAWNERVAGGGYLGTGFGFNVAWFDFYLRGRVQLTDALNIPATWWFSGVGGLQATIVERVKIFVAGGVAYYYNELDDEMAPLMSAGISVFFDTMPSEKH